jgi:hypothetical protein
VSARLAHPQHVIADVVKQHSITSALAARESAMIAARVAITSRASRGRSASRCIAGFTSSGILGSGGSRGGAAGPVHDRAGSTAGFASRRSWLLFQARWR